MMQRTPDLGKQGEGESTMKTNERHTMNNNNPTAEPEIDPTVDALLTVTAITRVLMGSPPEGQDGDEVLERLYGRFEGRTELLFEASMGMVEYLLYLIEEQGGPVSSNAAINSFLARITGPNQP